ncbi:glycoside hydrolase family 43 [Lecanosticta acicola]|uniref:Glycoside hydrolase family 43 n=1 Tax=Lecanosticta acicola TaxID=111012 RepID=A0AAI9E9D6_9PEZI|nr:glycoside hydrolase family 43 [Lecanosticta acicola]
MGGANFPDPAIIRTTDGWHLFSTNANVGGKLVHVQRGFTADWKSFTLRKGVDALPNLPSWVDPKNPRVWAPDVVRISDGTFVMYYTAAYKAKTNLHCLGFATANKITDPFVDSSTTPWICPTARGGAIDVAGFTDETNGNARYVVYKIDGNAIGHGGSCGNTVAPIVPTPIMLQRVAANGHTLIGGPTQILTNIASDGPYVEAPSLTYMNGKYVLFFSSQCYMTTGYDVEYAIADKITGPYKRSGTVFKTGTLGLSAPGGLDVAINGDHAIFHGFVHRFATLPLPSTSHKGKGNDHDDDDDVHHDPDKFSFDEKHCKNFETKADCKKRNYQKVRAAYVVTLSMEKGVVKATL